MIFISGLLACNQHPKKKSIENTLSQNAQSVSLTTKQLFPENSIGVAYLDTIKENKYFLTVRFPNSNLPDSIFHRDSTNYTKSISINTQPQIFILFDEAGEILTLQNVTGCISEFWCELSVFVIDEFIEIIDPLIVIGNRRIVLVHYLRLPVIFNF